jgi:hypothetical protein
MNKMSFMIKNLGLRIWTLWSLIALLLSSTTISSYGQVSQPHRYEKIQKRSDEFYTIIPLKDEGIALLQERDKYEGSKRIWSLILLDTALTEKRTTDFQVEARHNLVGHEYTKGHVYLLYRTGDTNKNNLELFDFDVSSGEQRGYYEIKPELDFKLTHFIKAGSNMVFGGYVSKDPVVLIYELATKLIKVVPGFFQKDNELVDLRANQNQTFNTVVIDRSTRTEKKLVFRTFNDLGEMLLEDVVDIDDSKSLQTSITSTLEGDELMVLGTYGARQSKQSLGFFALPVDPFNEQKIRYMDFSQLQHYLDGLKPARVKRIKESAEKAIAAGRNTEWADYVMPYKIEENKNGFLLLAEVYERSSSMSQYNNPYGSPMYGGYSSPYYYNPYMPYYYYPSRMYRPYNFGNNVKNTEEIRTTEAVLLSLDSKGNLLWDQSLKIKDAKRSSLEQISDFHLSKGDVYFLFRDKENELKVKKIEIDNNEASDSTIQIKLSQPFDEYRSEREELGIKKWYDNVFYAWGYQTIRNINNKDDRVRDVFYINKIVVH